MKLRLFLLLLVCGGSALVAAQSPQTPPQIDTGRFQTLDLLWDLKALSTPPGFEWTETKAPIRSLVYDSVPFEGKPTRVFAYYSDPDLLAGKVTDRTFPGVVLVHGGGGKAFKEWVEKWAAAGYAAIAMDLGGKDGAGQPLAQGGPDQSHEMKFNKIEQGDPRQVWSYHAVASVILAHSLLLNLPQVDANKTCLTGISWGGYLTCMVAGLDNRFQAAVPVYGCGYYDESDAFGPVLAALTPEAKTKWMRFFDPSAYLPYATVPMLFVNGNKDQFYNSVPYDKTWRLVTKCPKLICIKPDMKHSHPDGWAPVEIKLYFDSMVNEGTPLPTVGELQVHETTVEVGYSSISELKTARFYYSSDTASKNKDRVWSDLAATIDPIQHTIRCEFSGNAFSYAFFYVTDSRGASVSSPIFVKSAKPER